MVPTLCVGILPDAPMSTKKTAGAVKKSSHAERGSDKKRMAGAIRKRRPKGGPLERRMKPAPTWRIPVIRRHPAFMYPIFSVFRFLLVDPHSNPYWSKRKTSNLSWANRTASKAWSNVA